MVVVQITVRLRRSVYIIFNHSLVLQINPYQYDEYIKKTRYTCPLNMYHFVFHQSQPVGYEVVLYCRVRLHDIAAFTPNIKVVDGVSITDLIGWTYL